MTETQFTKGPLKAVMAYGHGQEPIYVSVQQAEGQYRGPTAYVCPAENIDGVTRDEMFANANLYAASPDMFEALSSVLELRENTSPFGGELQEDRIERAFDKARAALAKARGES